MSKQIIFTGALEDNRAPSDKSKDWMHKEANANAGGGIIWGPLSAAFKSYPIRDQDGSGSCVAQTMALMLGIENEIEEDVFVELSASDPYQRRSNRGAGMVGTDAMKIASEYGATFEILMPSQQMGETAINSVPRKPSFAQISQVFKAGGWLHPDVGDIEDVADVLAMGKPVMVWFRFPRSEWTSRPRPLAKLDKNALYLDQVGDNIHDVVHHSVTALPYSAHIGDDGKKYFIVQDSWGHHSTTENGLRYISEDYFKARNTFAAYFKDMPNNWRDNESVPDLARPKVSIPVKTLRIGMRSEAVRDLQIVLKYEEVFPQTIDVTGYYGSITASAVRKLQAKYGLTVDGIAGRQTITFINNKYK